MANLLARQLARRNLSPLLLAFAILAAPLAADAGKMAAPRLKQIPNRSMAEVIRVNFSDDNAAQELSTWLRLQEEKNSYTFTDYAIFMAQHRDWPKRSLLAKRAEARLTGRETASILIPHFTENKPQGFAAAKAFIEALRDEGRAAEAEAEIKRFWVYGNMTNNEQIDFLDQNEKLLTSYEIAQRAERLLWDNDPAEARTLANHLGSSVRSVIEARIRIRGRQGDPVEISRAVSDTYANDPGLIYDMANAYSTRDEEPKAAAVLTRNTPPGAGPADAWFKLRNRVARDVLEAGNPQLAYKVISQHGLKAEDGVPYREAEWLAGFIGLRFLNDPALGERHFSNMLLNAPSIVMSARAYYWLGRSYATAGDSAKANAAYEKATQYPTVYEAQAAAEERYGAVRITLPEMAEPSSAAKAAFNSRPLVQAVRAAVKLNNTMAQETFMYALGDSARTQEDATLIVRLGKELKRPGLSVIAAMRVGSKGFVAGRESYPTVSLPHSKPSPAFVHAIARRESLFNPEAKSPVGALGMMQLMPNTAARTAKSLGIRHTAAMLTSNPAHNMRLGSVYLNDMLEMFGTPAMAAAAYNAGPGRLLGMYNSNAGKVEDGWLCRLGDPRNNFEMRPIFDDKGRQLDRCNVYANALPRLWGARAATEKPVHKMIDWLEMISFGETRDYVRYIVSGYNMYEAVMAPHDKPATLRFSEKLLPR